MFENLFKTVPDTTGAIEPEDSPTLYVQDEDGEFTEQQDILYAPGTVFYIKSPDGTFEPEANAPDPEVVSPVTLDFMIETSIAFLRENGYAVTLEAELPVMHHAANYDTSIYLDQLRGMVVSHVSNRGSIDDMCNLIEKIKAGI